MRRLIVKSTRCFQDFVSPLLRPITVLVGENSSGKTTFLSLLRLAWDVAGGQPTLDFNEEPFQLGSYDQIASYRGGRAGRANSFCIGCTVEPPEDGDTREIRAVGRFEARGAQPELCNWTLQWGELGLELRYGAGGTTQLLVTTPAGVMSTSGDQPSAAFSNRPANLVELLGSGDFSGSRPKQSEVNALVRACDAIQGNRGRRPFAFAPIRTRPLRTYDPLQEYPHPEGSHVPMVLARAMSSSPGEWKKLKETLEKFGLASGLYQAVDVKRMGRKESDPFQIRCKISGPDFNLVDVGYGISQILPIIVDLLRSPAGSTFLLQQPEVHLHPRAQAELATFLAVVARDQQKRVVIETHSDHIVDRLRMDIRDGRNLSHNDVTLLYFERRGGAVEISHVGIDEHGNIVRPPPGYRRFFMEEETRMLGGSSQCV